MQTQKQQPQPQPQKPRLRYVCGRGHWTATWTRRCGHPHCRKVAAMLYDGDDPVVRIALPELFKNGK